MLTSLKRYETIGCCGIDCGLCPRYYTKGESACPGCGGTNFKEKHPSCGFLTCCVIKNGLEVCSDCKDYPCQRFDPEKAGYDSFVTHKKVFENLDFIKINGIELFIENQRKRIDVLKDLLTNFDDGRCRGFYCISCTLLPDDKMPEISGFIQSLDRNLDLREKSKVIKSFLTEMAGTMNIELKLNKKE